MEADRLNPLNLLLRGPDQPRPSFRWGTVTAVNPSTSRAAEEIAKSVSQQVNIAFIGDSETAGVTLSTSGYERSWPVVFSHLAGTVGGHAYRNNHNGSWNPDPRWVIDPGASYSAGGGFVPRHSIGLGETLDGKTLFLVTHRSSLLSLVDRLMIIDNGKIVADGPKEDVLKALRQGQIRASNT